MNINRPDDLKHRNNNRQNDYAPNIALDNLDPTPSTRMNQENRRYPPSQFENGHNDFFAKFKQALTTTLTVGKETAKRVIDKANDPEFRRSVNDKLDSLAVKAKENIEKVKESETTHKIKEGARKGFEETKRSLTDSNVLKANLDAFATKVKDIYTTLDSEEFRDNIHKKLSKAINPDFVEKVQTEDKGVGTDDVEIKGYEVIQEQPKLESFAIGDKKPLLLFDSDDEDILHESYITEGKKYSNDNSFYEINSKLFVKDANVKDDDSFSI